MARSFVKMIQNSRDQFAVIFVRKRRRRRRSGVGGGSNTKEYQSAWEKDFQEGHDRQAGGQPGRREEGGRDGQTRINQPILPSPSEWIEWSLNAPKEKSVWPDRRKIIEEDLRTTRTHARARPHVPFLSLIFN